MERYVKKLLIRRLYILGNAPGAVKSTFIFYRKKHGEICGEVLVFFIHKYKMITPLCKENI